MTTASDGDDTAAARLPVWRSERPAIRWAAYAWAFIGFAVAFVLLWRGLGYIRIVLVPFTLALFPAAILSPVAAWLEERGWPPALAAFAVLVVFLVVLSAILGLMVMQIQNQLSGLVEQLRSAYEQFVGRINDLPGVPSAGELFQGLRGGQTGDGGAQAAISAVSSVTRLVVEFFLFLVASFFFVKDRDQIAHFIERLFPASIRNDVDEIGVQLWGTVSGYIRGQTIIAAVDGTFVAIGLFLLGIPLAIVLGAIVFFGAFVPVAGSIAAGAVAVLVALVTEGLTAAGITLAIIVGVQQLEGNVLAPVILGRAVEIHPLAILAAITIGGVLLGIWGAVIAVPLTASIYRAASYVRDHQQDDVAAETAARP